MLVLPVQQFVLGPRLVLSIENIMPSSWTALMQELV